MTLKNSFLIAFSAITLTSFTAGAYIVGGPIQPGQPFNPQIPGGVPGDDFGNPGQPLPPDDFGNPGRPLPPRPPRDGGRHGNGRLEQKIIYLSRRVVNETLHLRQLAGIGQNYAGYNVESVVVDLRGSGPRAVLNLLVNSRVEDTVYSPQGSVAMRLPYRAVIGQDIQSLQLDIRGVADIETITINLREGDRYDRPDRPDRPGQTIDVPVYVSRRMYGNDRLDLGRYIDMRAYSGHRIQEIVIEATPVYNTALLDLLINGFNQGQTLQIDRYNSYHSIRPYNAVIGQGADSIVLYSRGDLDIRRVTLRISRY